MKITYYLKRLIHIPAIEIRLLLKGYFICLLLLPVVYLLPLKYYISHLKLKTRSAISEEELKYYIHLARKTMRRINRFSPVEFSCLIKSATFKILLNDFGIESSLALGVNISQESLIKAHAYVRLNESIIFNGKKKFTEVYFIV